MSTKNHANIQSNLKKAEALKAEGNSYFQKGKLQNAIDAYTNAITILPIQNNTSDSQINHYKHLRPTILSNRALCRIKLSEHKAIPSITKKTELLVEAVKDCTDALKQIDDDSSSSSSSISGGDTMSLRAKILFRRAKSYFLQSKYHDESSKVNEQLNLAAKDLLNLLSFDRKNNSATTLLRQVREKHNSNKTSPVSQALHILQQNYNQKDNIKDESSNDDKKGFFHEKYDSLKLIYGHLCQDLSSISMELGRRGGVSILSQIASSRNEFQSTNTNPNENYSTDTTTAHNNNKNNNNNNNDMDFISKSKVLSIQILSLSASYIPFAILFLRPNQFRQSILSSIVNDSNKFDIQSDLVIAAISLMLRIVIAFHREDEQQQQKQQQHNRLVFMDKCVDGSTISKICINAFKMYSLNDTRTQKAAMELLSTWTSSDWEEIALSASSSPTTATTTGSKANSTGSIKHKKLSETEIRSLPPKEFAAYRKHEYESMIHRKNCSKRNVLLFCDDQTGGLHALLQFAIQCGDDHRMRREIGLIIGRMLHTLIIDDGSAKEKEEGKVVKKLVGPILGYDGLSDAEEKVDGLTIEEIYDDDDNDNGNEGDSTSDANKSDAEEKLIEDMKRGLLTSSLLLCDSEVGTWALSHGWANGDGSSRLQSLIRSNNMSAMSIASEVVSSAASVEKARPLLSPLIQNGDFESLLKHENGDIRSGAASAMAKLGLASKGVEGVDGEGEVMGLLQVAADLLYEGEDDENIKNLNPKMTTPSSQIPTALVNQNLHGSSAAARGIELLSYLSSKTLVKEEIAHGFRTSKAPNNKTTLDRLVEMTRDTNIITGESITSYGIATIFALMAVSLETLRREAFIGKDVTAEQYEELQSLAKTQEEKETAKEAAELEKDLPEAVNYRIRKMASADVPLAIVKLMDACGYSSDSGHGHDTTLEQLVIAMERMAIEPSVRGIMIQQGCLTSCIKLEEGESSSEKRKKILRHARHSISKILVTTNPNLLTSAQRLGSIRPMIQLVNDNESSDLAKFEALLSITNVASIGMETKTRIVSEKGINILTYAMFSEHEMVRRAATEAMSNLVPHEAMMEHLTNGEKLRLWVSFASDFEEHLECAKAASGCLAMASADLKVAKTLVKSKNFSSMIKSLLECGNLELMHRVLVIVLNLLELKDPTCLEEVMGTGAVAFCEAYAASFGGSVSRKREELGFNAKDEEMMQITLDLAMKIVSSFR